MTMQVKFSDVGRGKLSWTAECTGELSYQWLVKQIKQRGALGSRDIDFGDEGTIFVGGFRPVGRFEVLEQGVEA